MYDNSKTIKFSDEQVTKMDRLNSKYHMNDNELVRLGVDLLDNLDEKGELLKTLQKILEK